jgi:hypothetical protein
LQEAGLGFVPDQILESGFKMQTAINQQRAVANETADQTGADA